MARPHSLTAALAVAALAAGCGSAAVASSSRPAAVAALGGSALSVSAHSCVGAWNAPAAGRSTFTLVNHGDALLAVSLIDARTGGIYGALPTLPAGVRRPLTVTVPAGRYRWRCVPLRGLARLSPVRTITGSGGKATRPIFALSSSEINGADSVYSHWISDRLATLATDSGRLESDLESGALDTARLDWLTAHLDYERLGAAYGTFGDLDAAINGSPAGLRHAVSDPAFTGFLRLEYGLWHGQSAEELQPIAKQLTSDIQTLERRFSGPRMASVAAADLPLRAHEILENTLQKVLTGRRDEGSHTELDTLAANVAGTQEVVSVLSQAIVRRAPVLLHRIRVSLGSLSTLVDGLNSDGETWPTLSRGEREQVLSAIDGTLEDLAPIPDILPMPPSTAPT